MYSFIYILFIECLLCAMYYPISLLKPMNKTNIPTSIKFKICKGKHLPYSLNQQLGEFTFCTSPFYTYPQSTSLWGY